MKESLSGVDGVRTALNTVLSELHKVLYKQLLAWLLQGNLYDPYQGRTSHLFPVLIIFGASGSVIIFADPDPLLNKKNIKKKLDFYSCVSS